MSGRKVVLQSLSSVTQAPSAIARPLAIRPILCRSTRPLAASAALAWSARRAARPGPYPLARAAFGRAESPSPATLPRAEPTLPTRGFHHPGPWKPGPGRARLLGLLAALTAEQWSAVTAGPDWS